MDCLLIKYEIEVDGSSLSYNARSLAEVAAFIRDTPCRVSARVWNAESGLLLIDTKFGDSYHLVIPVVKQ